MLSFEGTAVDGVTDLILLLTELVTVFLASFLAISVRLSPLATSLITFVVEVAFLSFSDASNAADVSIAAYDVETKAAARNKDKKFFIIIFSTII